LISLLGIGGGAQGRHRIEVTSVFVTDARVGDEFRPVTQHRLTLYRRRSPSKSERTTPLGEQERQR